MKGLIIYMEKKHFPLFISTEGKNVVVFGCGLIGTRRIKTLVQFDFNIRVVSPVCSKDIDNLQKNGNVEYINSLYDESFMEGMDIVLACTNERKINHEIGKSAKDKNLLVSVCDCREECNFYFPAIALNEEVTVGIVGEGLSHTVTKNAANTIREIVKGKAY